MPEIINQILTDITTPTINANVASRVTARTLLRNIFQGVIFESGRGVTNTYTEDINASQIQVRRILPLQQEARELGASINGGSFNNEESEYTTSTAYGLNILTVIDRPVLIPQVTLDIMNVDVLSAQVQSLSGIVNRNINAMTIAVQLKAGFSEEDGSNVVTLDGTNTAWRTAILNAQAKLDGGDEENSIDVFNENNRAICVHADVQTALFAQGVFSLGGSNVAQMQMINGQLTPNTTPTKLMNGYLGDFGGVAVHFASDIVWRTAEKFLGLPKFTLDETKGYEACGDYTSRGVATAHDIKFVDARGGQGVEMQPLIRMGCETFFPKSIIPIVSDATRANFIELYKNLRSDNSYAIEFLASKSRPTITAQIAVKGANATPSFSATNGAHVSTKYVFADVNSQATLADFYKAYTASGAQKGSATNNTAVALTASGTKVMLLLVEAVVNNVATLVVVKSASVVKA